MGPVGIFGSRGNGIVQLNPEQKLRNSIAHAVGQVVHFPAEGRQYIGNVIFKPKGDGNFVVQYRENIRSFTRSDQLRANVYAYYMATLDRGIEAYSKIGLTSDSPESVDPYALGFGAPEDNDGNRR